MASFIKKPYFMENKEWYKRDEKTYKYVLTDKATPEAVESYNAFYKDLEGASYGNIQIERNSGGI